jgi:hypothetical protein
MGEVSVRIVAGFLDVEQMRLFNPDGSEVARLSDHFKMPIKLTVLEEMRTNLGSYVIFHHNADPWRWSGFYPNLDNVRDCRWCGSKLISLLRVVEVSASPRVTNHHHL